MKKTRTRGKQLSTFQILKSRISSPKLRAELDKLSGMDYINYVIEVEKCACNVTVVIYVRDKTIIIIVMLMTLFI